MERTKNSKVLTIANHLVSQGYGRAAAMLKAWALVKLPLVETKVAGVTFGRRQTAIEHLTRYAPEQIAISLQRDRENVRDRNAVAVIATVEGRGSYCMGYLPRSLAAFVAPLLDTGRAVQAVFREVRGGQTFMNYGLAIAVRV